MNQRRTTFKPFLSRRAIENRLGRKLFAEPWVDYDHLYWVKYMKVETLSTVLVLPDRSGQQMMQTAAGREPLYESLLDAMRQCDEQDVTRRLKASEVVVFDLSEHSEQLVSYDVVEMGDVI